MSEPRPKQILVVDDDEAIRGLIKEILLSEPYEIDEAVTGAEALEKLKGIPYDGLILDLQLPDMHGLKILDEALMTYPDLMAIVVTGYGTIESAVEAIQKGAFDYITKPFQVVEFPLLLARGFERKHLREENRDLRAQLMERYSFSNIVGRSPAMTKIFSMIETISLTNSTVLISGETGTGKELIARAIHYNSPRRDEKMVSINCGAISEHLLESELFGHVKGAFTGAHQLRIGRFEQAHRGTIFLDEVGNMSLGLQVKLLRVLQEREFERVGANETIKVDVRVIAATSANLAEKVRQGAFREDLYYRLNVIPIEVPPLRERLEDIPLLAQHFVRKICATQQIPEKTLSQEAVKGLMAYSWPGNIRQLENCIERAIALAGRREQITSEDWPEEIRSPEIGHALYPLAVPDQGLRLEDVLETIERHLIKESLRKAGGNRQRAANLLNLKRTTLVEKIKKHQLSDTDS